MVSQRGFLHIAYAFAFNGSGPAPVISMRPSGGVGLHDDPHRIVLLQNFCTIIDDYACHRGACHDGAVQQYRICLRVDGSLRKSACTIFMDY